MKKIVKKYSLGFFVVFILFTTNNSYAKLVLEDNKDEYVIGDEVYIFTDENSSYKFDQIQTTDTLFHRSEQRIPNLGVSDATFWVKIEVENNSDKDVWYLDLNYPNLDYIEFFYQEDGKYQSIVLGESQPFSNRKYDDPNYMFDLHVGKSKTTSFYLKIRSGEQVLLPLKISTFNIIFNSMQSKSVIIGLYVGIMLVMFLYNFFVFMTVRDLSYLYYVLYILFIGLSQITLQGYSFKWFWPDNATLAIPSIFFLSSFAGAIMVFFVNNFLNVSQFYPRINKLSYAIAIMYFVNIFVTIFGDYNLSTHILDIGAGLVTVYALTIAILISRKGERSAKYFLIAWIIVIIGALIFVLRNSGVLPMNVFTNYTMPFGTAVETILLSFALADRINILKKEKEDSQYREVKVLKENERLVREQNVILEQKVDERTTELKQTNNDLNTTLKNLKETQAQLVDAEKMASLGQLTAGIAHEINNPINFVTSNIKPLKRDIEDLLSLIEGFESEVGGHEELMGKINELKEEYDYEYVIEEVESLLQGIDDGAQRTAEIVRGLKNFSRLDEGELKKANINEGLTSTLTVLNSSIMGTSVKLVKDLDPNIPETECYPGKLNQVFMNIITNAIQAVNDNSHEKGKSIDITTRLENELIKISIKDNGCGMPDSVKEKIFEPFFTTKDVGEGTGLGLSIVQGIIEAHQGEINIITEQGTGTEFLISLPLKTS